jgi:hypothetical protein
VVDVVVVAVARGVTLRPAPRLQLANSTINTT